MRHVFSFLLTRMQTLITLSLFQTVFLADVATLITQNEGNGKGQRSFRTPGQSQEEEEESTNNFQRKRKYKQEWPADARKTYMENSASGTKHFFPSWAKSAVGGKRSPRPKKKERNGLQVKSESVAGCGSHLTMGSYFLLFDHLLRGSRNFFLSPSAPFPPSRPSQ